MLLSFVNRSPEQRLQETPSGSMPAVPLFSKTASVSNLRELSPFVFTNFEAHLFVRYCCILLFMEMKCFFFFLFLQLLTEMFKFKFPTMFGCPAFLKLRFVFGGTHSRSSFFFPFSYLTIYPTLNCCLILIAITSFFSPLNSLHLLMMNRLPCNSDSALTETQTNISDHNLCVCASLASICTHHILPLHF